MNNAAIKEQIINLMQKINEKAINLPYKKINYKDGQEKIREKWGEKNLSLLQIFKQNMKQAPENAITVLETTDISSKQLRTLLTLMEDKHVIVTTNYNHSEIVWIREEYGCLLFLENLNAKLAQNYTWCGACEITFQNLINKLDKIYPDIAITNFAAKKYIKIQPSLFLLKETKAFFTEFFSLDPLQNPEKLLKLKHWSTEKAQTTNAEELWKKIMKERENLENLLIILKETKIFIEKLSLSHSAKKNQKLCNILLTFLIRKNGENINLEKQYPILSPVLSKENIIPNLYEFFKSLDNFVKKCQGKHMENTAVEISSNNDLDHRFLIKIIIPTEINVDIIIREYKEFQEYKIGAKKEKLKMKLEEESITV